MKASDYIAAVLHTRGVQHVFEVSGGMITHLLDSIHRQGKIQVVSVHHEQAAAFAADAAGRITGRSWCCHGHQRTRSHESAHRYRKLLLRFIAGRLSDRTGKSRRTERRSQDSTIGIPRDRYRFHGVAHHQSRLESENSGGTSPVAGSSFCSGYRRAARSGLSGHSNGRTTAGRCGRSNLNTNRRSGLRGLTTCVVGARGLHASHSSAPAINFGGRRYSVRTRCKTNCDSSFICSAFQWSIRSWASMCCLPMMNCASA